MKFVAFVVAYFVGIMGDFAWRLLVKQGGPASGTVPPSTVAPTARERGQPTNEVGPVLVTAEVAPGAPSCVLAKRK